MPNESCCRAPRAAVASHPRRRCSRTPPGRRSSPTSMGPWRRSSRAPRRRRCRRRRAPSWRRSAAATRRRLPRAAVPPEARRLVGRGDRLRGRPRPRVAAPRRLRRRGSTPRSGPLARPPRRTTSPGSSGQALRVAAASGRGQGADPGPALARRRRRGRRRGAGPRDRGRRRTAGPRAALGPQGAGAAAGRRRRQGRRGRARCSPATGSPRRLRGRRPHRPRRLQAPRRAARAGRARHRGRAGVALPEGPVELPEEADLAVAIPPGGWRSSRPGRGA